MKTKITIFALFAFLFAGQIQAQDITTVRANNSDISDNLDLKAVASIFGESADLADFERRLNDPKIQISNLDLNGDNQVDYLRVIESAENNTHLILIQAVLEKDIFQDIATVEVERDSNNNVQIQVVGDVYMYGSNYIYEPVYVQRPVIYNVFWTNYYRPYYSPYYWSYYPSYYVAWNPYPVYRYRRNVHVHININNNYNYVNTRRSTRAESLYRSNRADGYARQYPNRSFAQRNNNVTNRQELVQTRNQNLRSNGATRNTSSLRNENAVRNSNSGTRNATTSTPVRNISSEVRTTSPTRTSTPMEATTRAQNASSNTRSISTPTRTESQAPVRNQAPVQSQTRTQSAPVRSQAPTQAPVRAQAPVQSQTRTQATPQQSQRSSGGESRGNSGGGRRG